MVSNTVNHRNGRLLSHDVDDLSRCDEPRVWKSFLNHVYAKEMIAVAMGST